MTLHSKYDNLLATQLKAHPSSHGYRWSPEADKDLRQLLFRSLVGAITEHDDSRLSALFPQGPPQDFSVTWRLREAQGAVEGAEYTEAARGRPCGHIFTSGESTYLCKTCAFDDTCVLCARCFTESDHEGHEIYVSVSPGNSGCCDCGDDEAWSRPVCCSIHKAGEASANKSSGKTAQAAGLPDELVQLVQMTIGRVLDFLCDVLSCSPEQLRLPKTLASVLNDERRSRLDPERYYGVEHPQEPCEYALVLWNDEKHTVDSVQDQVARACKQTRKFGRQKAHEVDELGRSIVHYSTDLPELLEMATILEQIKVSVTIRSSRDTFRECMCHTMIDWLSDISGCSMGSDGSILKHSICTELLGRWNVGSQQLNGEVGQSGIHDHEYEDKKHERDMYALYSRQLQAAGLTVQVLGQTDTDDDEGEDDDMGDENDDEREEAEGDEDDDVADGADADALATVNELLRTNRDFRQNVGAPGLQLQAMDVEQDGDTLVIVPRDGEADVEMEDDTEDTANEVQEATLAGYPPPPPPPAARQGGASRSRQASVTDSQSVTMMTPQESDEGEIASSGLPGTNSQLPKTPKHHKRTRKTRPPNYWLERPRESLDQSDRPIAENLWERLRIDHLILYDLRLWKTLRVLLRHLYISTMVTVPEFKRVLGLRFAGLYTMLSQLYLIADREPDLSIIHLSVQLMTTPSIAAEVIDRANFLTNLLAILYTFLTTRQVGYPKDVSSRTTLAFDAGTITNRRLFHFYTDIKYMFQSPFVRERIRTEPQYLMQFLDLVKLHQGICPNLRAVDQHVEYETDAWASASQLIREIVRFCRLIALGFVLPSNDRSNLPMIVAAIRSVGASATTASLGLEWQRFTSSEFKSEIAFTKIDGLLTSGSAIILPRVRVLHESMSFHHPLHYLLSWLLQAGKSMSAFQARHLLLFDVAELKLPEYPTATQKENGPFAPFIGAEDRLCALFDIPLRVMAWQAQIRADLWVRNGLTLRHQMHAYRNTQNRDHTFQRDIFMLQAGLVMCDSGEDMPGERFLAQIIDRFDMTQWVQFEFDRPEGFEIVHQFDVIEDFFNLLIVLLSEREDLLPDATGEKPTIRAIQRDIAHVLCFKPLSYSDLVARLTDYITDSDNFDDVLKSMTRFRAPGGLSDSGTFELLSENIELVDPYHVFYTRNMREDSENTIKTVLAKKRGKDAADVVPEPHLPPIPSGLFQGLSCFTRTTLFARAICSTLRFIRMVTNAETSQPIPTGRFEAFVPTILHLMLIAVAEDTSQHEQEGSPSFVENLFSRIGGQTILEILQEILQEDSFSACHPRIRLIISRAQEKRPQTFARYNFGSTEPVAVDQPAQTEEREVKKRQALERQARVMAQFKEQQSSFLTNQGIDWGVDDLSDEEDAAMHMGEETETVRPYPADPCMLCQEETNDDRLYGCFAFIGKSRILRQTPLDDDGFLHEVLDTPENLDRSAESIRPFGVSSKNRIETEKTTTDGTTIVQEQQVLSRGFPPGDKTNKGLNRGSNDATDQGIHSHVKEGPVTTSCGHIMHWSCFEQYLRSTDRRHSQQIARNHPERLARNEFLCPLCKALGNIFIPLIWKSKKEIYPGALTTEHTFDDWVSWDLVDAEERLSHLDKSSTGQTEFTVSSKLHAEAYVKSHFNSNLASSVTVADPDTQMQPTPITRTTSPARTGPLQSLAALLSAGREISAQIPIEGTPATPPTPAEELDRAYLRIQQTFIANGIGAFRGEAWQKLQTRHEISLADTLGYSISAAEIASRGVAGYPSCLSSISDLSLINLRIISETATSYVALRRLSKKALASEEVHNETMEEIEARHTAILLGKTSTERGEVESTLFRHDIFIYLVHCSVLQSSTWAGTGHHVLRACFLAEMVKVTITLLMMPGKLEPQFSNHERSAFPEEVLDLWKTCLNGKELLPEMTVRPSEQHLTMIDQAVRSYALVFLRKALILFHIRCGVDFAVVENELDPGMPELDRLTTLLRLPSYEEISLSLKSESSIALANRWIQHAGSTYSVSTSAPFSLSHPGIFELVGLPKTFDALTEEARKRPCPTTGKEVSDPALCLFCGTIFCSQASCCRNKATGEGGCNQHMRTCGGSVGLFIHVRKCMVLFLHGHHGSWANAPYLDKHGEADPTLRRHHQLFLEQKRYDRLFRDVWLQHGIQSSVSRRLEGDVNTGGWETL